MSGFLHSEKEYEWLTLLVKVKKQREDGKKYNDVLGWCPHVSILRQC